MSYRRLNEGWVTLIEGVETDDLDLEVAIEGHLPEDVIAESGLTCRRPSRHSDYDLLHWLLHEALLARLEDIRTHAVVPIII